MTARLPLFSSIGATRNADQLLKVGVRLVLWLDTPESTSVSCCTLALKRNLQDKVVIDCWTLTLSPPGHQVQPGKYRRNFSGMLPIAYQVVAKDSVCLA